MSFFCFYLISVSPESVVIPIVSCIFGFPLLALLVICCLRKRAKLARERDRRRNYDLQDHAVSLVRFSPIHRLCESDKLTTSNYPIYKQFFFNLIKCSLCNTFLLPVSSRENTPNCYLCVQMKIPEWFSFHMCFTTKIKPFDVKLYSQSNSSSSISQ